MEDRTFVYLITGFLGAGKTTFLNRIIDRFPKEKKLTLLINEFGEIGVDGSLVEGDEIDMMEISKGSIFCVCVKTDFIKGLYELDNKIRPDVLLIESTGVANPSDLKRDLALPIFNDRFKFREQFCILDAVHFLDAYDAYASLEKQIASSTAFILNKTDLATPEQVAGVKEVVARFHPDPAFHETAYCDIPLDHFFPEGFLEEPGEGGEAPAERMPRLTDAQLDQFIEELLDSPDLQTTPPDQLLSATYRWKGTDLDGIRHTAENLPKAVVRAKGFLETPEGLHIFNYVMGDWEIKPATTAPERIHHRNVVVFIAPPDAMEGVEQACDADQWTGLGTYQPFTSGGGA